MAFYKTIKQTGKGLILATSLTAILTMAGCGAPRLEQNKDLTGDGIADAIMKYEWGTNATYLFIGQKDGTFIRAKGEYGENYPNNAKYFKIENGDQYFFDGEFYRLSPKTKK